MNEKGTLAEGAESIPKRIYILIEGFNRSVLNDAELEELDKWILHSQENIDLFGELAS